MSSNEVEFINTVIDVNRPIKKPKALDVPIASLEGTSLFIRYGVNKVPPPIPRIPEISAKKNPIILAFMKLGNEGRLVDLLSINILYAVKKT